jgi:hypothetical protein
MKHFLPFIALLAASSALSFKVSGEDISASGWRLWPDRAATWKDDTLYLPAEVKLNEMP